MAFVVCPECGRKNISDSAESCPECAYPIKKHFKLKKQKEQYDKYQKHIEQQTALEVKRLELELKSKLREIDEAPAPEKPKLSKIFYKRARQHVIMLIWGVFGIVGILFGIYENRILLAVGIVALLIALGDIYFMLEAYKAEYSLYKQQTLNWEEYKEAKKQAVMKKYNEYAADLLADKPANKVSDLLSHK